MFRECCVSSACVASQPSAKTLPIANAICARESAAFGTVCRKCATQSGLSTREIELSRSSGLENSCEAPLGASAGDASTVEVNSPTAATIDPSAEGQIRTGTDPRAAGKQVAFPQSDSASVISGMINVS